MFPTLKTVGNNSAFQREQISRWNTEELTLLCTWLQSVANSAPCKQSRVLLRFKLFATIELQYSAVTGLTEMSAFQRESRLVQGFYVKFRYAAPELCVIKHSVFLR